MLRKVIVNMVIVVMKELANGNVSREMIVIAFLMVVVLAVVLVVLVAAVLPDLNG